MASSTSTPSSGSTAPPGRPRPHPAWATLALLTAAIDQAARAVSVTTPAAPGLPARTLAWGRQLDIRPVTASGDVTDTKVAGYVAKYATKAAECTGTLDRRITPTDRLTDLPVRDHARRHIAACLRLGKLPQLKELRLAAWAHMLGFRGHFSTKSRAYSSHPRLAALRPGGPPARVRHRRRAATRPRPRHHPRGHRLALLRARRSAGRWPSATEGRPTVPRLLMTVPEAAEALAISRSKLYELLASGAIASIRIDGSRRIPVTCPGGVRLQAARRKDRRLMSATTRTNTPRLRDGVMKRGTTWSYVIRVKDPETGISKPRWVGGFATEEDAKAARDEARVKARHGEYIDRNRITVAAYLDDWIDAHAMEIKPRTLADYRACIRLYAIPRIGHLPVQAVRPSTITKLYRDLLTSGGRDGQPLAVATVTHLHAVLRKAFRDAVIVDELIGSNPVERAKRPRAQAQEPGTVWTIAQLRTFLATAQQHRLFAFFHVAAYTGARRGELLNLRWKDIDLDGKKITITGSTAVIGGERVNGTTKSGRTRVVSIDDETVAVLRQRKADQAAEQLKAGDSWRGIKDGYVFTTGWGEPIYPDTVTSLMTKLIRANQQLPHARLHDLRHLHATTLLLSGVPVHVVAARLGHADPAITLRVYAHVIRSPRPPPLTSSPRQSRRPVSKPVSKKAPSKIGKGL